MSKPNAPTPESRNGPLQETQPRALSTPSEIAFAHKMSSVCIESLHVSPLSDQYEKFRLEAEAALHEGGEQGTFDRKKLGDVAELSSEIVLTAKVSQLKART